MITWEEQEEWLEQLPHRSQVEYALFCAMQIKDLWEDCVQAAKTVSTIKRFLKGEATARECNVAALNTYHRYAGTSDPAHATSAAAYTAADDDRQRIAAANATYAADIVIDAVADDAVESVKQEQVDYLRKLYIESLPEEQRNSWLVQACL